MNALTARDARCAGRFTSDRVGEGAKRRSGRRAVYEGARGGIRVGALAACDNMLNEMIKIVQRPAQLPVRGAAARYSSPCLAAVCHDAGTKRRLVPQPGCARESSKRCVAPRNRAANRGARRGEFGPCERRRGSILRRVGSSSAAMCGAPARTLASCRNLSLARRPEVCMARQRPGADRAVHAARKGSLGRCP